jgi:hypothetical protein
MEPTLQRLGSPLFTETARSSEILEKELNPAIARVKSRSSLLDFDAFSEPGN